MEPSELACFAKRKGVSEKWMGVNGLNQGSVIARNRLR